LPVIISPRAYVSKYAFIDEGSVIMHDAFINANAKIGKNCIINTKAIIEHDAIIEDNCHISTGSIINGGTLVRKNSFIGSNAMAKEYIEIKANSVIRGGCNNIKIGYFADGKWSHLAFEKLIKDNSVKIEFICVRCNTKDETLKNYCEKYNIDYLKHKNINSNEFLEKVKQYNCDLFVSMSFDQIFKKKILSIPKLKTINCHAGKLPFYRGRNVLNWVLINDEKEFGITVHYVDEGIDTGDIIMQRIFPITDNDDYNSLLEKAYIECANILYDSIKLIQKAKEIIPIKQDSIHPIGFYCSKRKKGDEIINWDQTSREIFNFVRAICKPGPIARTFLNGKEMKINKVELIKNAPIYKCISGTILKKENGYFIVKTKDSFIKVIEYEYNGKFKVGDRFE
jgi:methionyl-tRNA formyltransferase